MSEAQITKTYGPYSPARVVGDMVYISGQVGVDPETKTAGSDVTAQTKQVLENMARVLASEDLELSDVVKTTIYLRDMADFAEVNEVYGSYFSQPFPTRACVEVSGLPRVGGDTEILIEIEAMAQKRRTL